MVTADEPVTMGWYVSEHARERAAERGIPLDLLVYVATYPDIVTPADPKKHPAHFSIRTVDEVIVVCDPSNDAGDAGVIITCMNRGDSIHGARPEYENTSPRAIEALEPKGPRGHGKGGRKALTIREMLAVAESQGFRIVERKGKHIVRTPDGQPIMGMPALASNRKREVVARTARNVRAALARAGVKFDD